MSTNHRWPQWVVQNIGFYHLLKYHRVIQASHTVDTSGRDSILEEPLTSNEGGALNYRILMGGGGEGGGINWQ